MSSLKQVHMAVAGGAVLFALLVGGVAGFLLGIASTRFGKSLIEDIVESEESADTAHPKWLARDGFRLKHPGNWAVDTQDEDYDPDHCFSIESPGSAFVMFILGDGDLDPKETLDARIEPFRKLMSSPSIEEFERYGSLRGAGAILRGRILGSPTTVRLFGYCRDGLHIQITENCPDEDRRDVEAGLWLIEKSFSIEGSGKGSR